jgi:uncharacterized protein YdeI (YjbR/CyaY-like superfamily)
MTKKPSSKVKVLTEKEQCDLDENIAAIKTVPSGKVDPNFLHEMPDDLQKTLDTNPDVKEKWGTLTKLTKNEWICWVTIVKKPETRKEHLIRLCEDLRAGERRPCCWPGCPHRRKSAGKWFKPKPKSKL